MSDENDSSASTKAHDAFQEWGIDVDVFEQRARKTLADVAARLREIRRAGGPAAAELKTGLERAFEELDKALAAVREKLRETQASTDPDDDTMSR